MFIYDHFRNVKHHNEYIIVENWADDESVEKHNQTTHLKTFFREKNSCLFGRGNCTKKSAAAKQSFFSIEKSLHVYTMEGFVLVR